MAVISSSMLLPAALLFLWAALLFGSYLLPAGGTTRHDVSRNMLLASSGVLTIAAWSTLLFLRFGPLHEFALLIALGMSFGFLGDLFMARVLRAPDRLITGMGSFGIGHLFYIAAGLNLGNDLGLDDPFARFGAWLACLLLAALGWYFLLARHHRPTAMLWTVLAYALLLASTAGVAAGLALQSPSFLPFAAGALLFLSSDFLIALRDFAGRKDDWILKAIWLTYGPGQALIVYTVSIAAAARQPV